MNNEEEFFAALERELSTRMAASPRARIAYAYKPRRIIASLLILITGLIGLVASVAVSSTITGVVSFATMFAGAYLLSTAITLTRH